MRIIPTAICSVALLFGPVFAQQTPSSDAEPRTPQTQTPRSDEQPTQPTQEGQTSASAASQTQGSKQLKIAPGSVIPVEMAKTVDAKKAKTGDEVVAKVTQDMKATSGEVLVPKDTKVIGHVTEAQARNKEQKQSQLGIAFDRAEVKGDQMQLPMSIQAVIAPPSPSNNSSAGGPAPAAAPTPSSGSSPNAASAGSHGAGMSGTGQAAPRQTAPSAGNTEAPPDANNGPEINGKTTGVIGMSDVKLESAAQNSQQGSVLTSEKNNVKIEKGTMLLLRVNQ